MTVVNAAPGLRIISAFPETLRFRFRWFMHLHDFADGD
jgi:hypothetical protein